MVRSVTSSGADDRLHFRSSKHLMKFIDPALHSSRKVQVPIEDVLRIDRIEAEFPQPRDASVKFLAIDRSGGRDDPNGIFVFEDGWTPKRCAADTHRISSYRISRLLSAVGDKTLDSHSLIGTSPSNPLDIIENSSQPQCQLNGSEEYRDPPKRDCNTLAFVRALDPRGEPSFRFP
jgi:hypothetical protein